MRRIPITLAEDTTEIECGSCQHKIAGYCSIFAWRLRSRGLAHARHPECLAAEASARMDEIAADARLGSAVREAIPDDDVVGALIDGDETPMYESGASDRVMRAIAAWFRARAEEGGTNG